ncbi:MAG: hypothetical protein SGPRY_012920 [Prymnesium sp.]
MGFAFSAAASSVEQDLANDPTADPHTLQSLYELQSGRATEPNPNIVSRPITAMGSLVFTGSWQRQTVSRITGERIKGPKVMLEDGVSSVGKSEAIMWAKLHPFSPTHSGKLLNPF